MKKRKKKVMNHLKASTVMNQRLILMLPLVSLHLNLLLTPITAFRPPFRRRILHHPLFPSPSPPYTDHPFFPKVPVYASPPPSVPANAASHGPIPTSTFSSSTSVVPAKKLAITISVTLVTLGMLSALVFFLYRRHLHPSPSDSRKLVAPPMTWGGISREEKEEDDDLPKPKNFLYLGTVGHSSTGGNSDSLKCSPYRKLNSGNRMEFGRYRPSPELMPLPPLMRLPPPDSIVQRMFSSEEDEDVIVAGRGTETAFCTPRGSLVSNDEGYYTPVSRQSVRSITKSNSTGSGESNTSRNGNHLRVLHSKRTSARSRLSESSPDMKHIIIPSINQEVGPHNLRLRSADPPLPPNAALLQSISISLQRTSKVSAPPPPPPPPPPPVPRPLEPTASNPDPKMGEDAGLLNRIKDVEEIDKIAGSGSLLRQNGYEMNTGRPKLKPLHWDKVRAYSDRGTVWDQIKSSSFQVNENMMETLFGFNPSNATIPKDQSRRPGWATSDLEIRVLDPKKSQNIAILLRALNVTRDEVSEALLDGNPEGLGTELLETLVKMAPTKEEEIRLLDYRGCVSKLGTAERFLKAILDIPFAFKRVEAMLYRANFDAEVKYLRKSFQTLQVASEELRNSRLFFKLLEAVLRTGNRMNVGTTRGDARAFKLDTLLKLVDIKGANGKTTLLHFVVQEIIRSEGKDANQVKDHSQTKFQSLSENGFRKEGLQVLAGLSRDLSNVKKAATMDSDVLGSYLSKLDTGLDKVRQVLQYQRPDMQGIFFDSIKAFLREAEDEILRIKGEEKRALSHVKEATEYFHGDSAKEEAHPLRIFLILRDFLSNLDHVCRDVGRMQDQTMVGAARSFSRSSTSPTTALERYNCRKTGISDEDSS